MDVFTFDKLTHIASSGPAVEYSEPFVEKCCRKSFLMGFSSAASPFGLIEQPVYKYSLYRTQIATRTENSIRAKKQETTNRQNKQISAIFGYKTEYDLNEEKKDTNEGGDINIVANGGNNQNVNENENQNQNVNDDIDIAVNNPNNANNNENNSQDIAM